MWWLIIPVVIVIIIVIVVIVKFSKSSKSSKSSSDSNGNGKTVLRITGEGTNTESYRMPIGRREHYLIIPNVTECLQEENKPQWCEDMNYQSTYGMAYIYDEQLGPNVKQDVPCSGEEVCERIPNTCPGGGYACTFFERYNDDGDLIAITNGAGENMLDKMAADAWAGKWEEWDMVKKFKKDVEYEDGKMLFTKDIPSIDIKAGDELTLNIALKMGVPTMYFIALLVLMSDAGEAKPDEIVLDVKGARESFKRRVSDSRPTEGKKDEGNSTPKEDNEVQKKSEPEAIKDYEGIEAGKKYKIGMYESLYGRDKDSSWCRTNGTWIECAKKEDEGYANQRERQYYTFVEKGDKRYNLTDYMNHTCSAYDTDYNVGQVLCKENDSDPDVYRLISVSSPGRFKLFNETKNKYCLTKMYDGAISIGMACTTDSKSKGDTFRHK